jgi:inhibitor of cysteine peptidase
VNIAAKSNCATDMSRDPSPIILSCNDSKKLLVAGESGDYCATVKTRLVLLVALLVASVVFGGVGCSKGSPQATKTIEVPMDDVLNGSDISRDVTLAVGNTLKVVLGSNHTTPYRWMADAKIGDPAIVKQTSHEFVQPHADDHVMGAPGTEVWMFTALKTGTTTIATTYATFVGGDNTPTCTFTAKVTVQ